MITAEKALKITLIIVLKNSTIHSDKAIGHANYKTKSKTSEEEMQLNMGTTDDKNTSSPTIITNLKIDETIDLTEVSKNIDEEEAYFSYFSTILKL